VGFEIYFLLSLYLSFYFFLKEKSRAVLIFFPFFLGWVGGEHQNSRPDDPQTHNRRQATSNWGGYRKFDLE
jgi:hypothetical protein